MSLAPALLAAAALLANPGSAPAPPPGAVQELLLEGIRLHEMGAYDEAIAVYRRVLEADPSNTVARYELAFSTVAKGDYPAAIELLDRIVSSPETAPPGAWLLLGSARAMVGHWSLAEQTFRQGLAIRPDDPALRFHLALALSAQGRFEVAIDEFEGCLRSSPYRAEVWRAFGDVLLDSGAKGRAFAAYARAVTLDGDSAPSKEIARKMWEMIFEGVGHPDDSSPEAAGQVIRARVPRGTSPRSPSAAEAAGMAMLAVLRYQDPWKDKSDAAFFVYAVDTILALVSSLHDRDVAAPFWDPFLIAYFRAMRAGGHIEALAYDIRSVAGDPDAAAWRESNVAKLKAFRRSSEGWAVDWMAEESNADRR